MRASSVLTISATTAVAVAGLSLASLPDSAEAAVTVLSGAGPAQSCYEGAENGGDAGEYIFYCNEALGGALTQHDRAATYINRGVLRLALNEVNAAKVDFNTGLSIDPQLGDGYIDLAAALIADKQYADALKAIDKGLSLGPRKPEIAYYDRGVADEALGDIPAAYHDYQQALTAQPDFSLASDELKRFKVVHKVSDGT